MIKVNLALVEVIMSLMDFKSACKELNIKPSTLYQYCEAQLVPVIRVGKLLRFDRDQLIDWFKSGNFKKARQETLQGKNGKAR